MSGLTKHRGKGITLGGTSTVNAFKMTLEAQTAAPPPVREFKPLKVQSHPRAAEMQAYAALPSRFK